jgi:hypothetical protein
MLIAILILLLSPAGVQTDQARVMGAVTDGSGGALPGVTVTISGSQATSQSLVTDGSGRYISGWLPPANYTITFILSGFETRTLKNVPLGAGQTVVLDQQLPLAALTETVQVTAAAPPPPPPPAPAPPPPPARPVIRPVDADVLASVCGPRQAMDYSLAIGKVVSHRDDANRQLMGPGDVVRIDAGEEQGMTAGQNFVVRRRFHTGDPYAPKKLQTFGEQTAGLVQILETKPASSMAVVVKACGEILTGDTIERYVAQPAFFAVAAGTPRFDEPAKITVVEYGRTAASEGQMMVIDRGIMQGAQRGQRLTIFRAGSQGRPRTLGDAVIVAVRADSATILLGKTTDAVTVGDLAALHR